MERTLNESIMMAAELVFGAMLIGTISAILIITNMATSAVEKEDALVTNLSEYKGIYKFDDKEISTNDAIEFIVNNPRVYWYIIELEDKKLLLGKIEDNEYSKLEGFYGVNKNNKYDVINDSVGVEVSKGSHVWTAEGLEAVLGSQAGRFKSNIKTGVNGSITGIVFSILP